MKLKLVPNKQGWRQKDGGSRARNKRRCASGTPQRPVWLDEHGDEALGSGHCSSSEILVDNNNNNNNNNNSSSSNSSSNNNNNSRDHADNHDNATKQSVLPSATVESKPSRPKPSLRTSHSSSSLSLSSLAKATPQQSHHHHQQQQHPIRQPQRSVSFSPSSPQEFLVPSKNDLSATEHSGCWYSRDDYERISTETIWSDECRGLEHRDGSHQRNTLVAVNAVLDEQERQRFDGISDSVVLCSVCIQATRHCRSDARRKALQDQELVALEKRVAAAKEEERQRYRRRRHGRQRRRNNDNNNSSGNNGSDRSYRRSRSSSIGGEKQSQRPRLRRSWSDWFLSDGNWKGKGK